MSVADTHVIWGDLENSGSTEQLSSSYNGSPDGSFDTCQRSGGHLSKDVRAYLQTVNFRDQSSSSTRGSSSNSFPSSSHNDNRSAGNGSQYATSIGANSSGQVPEMAREEDGEPLYDSDEDGADLQKDETYGELWSAGSVEHASGNCRPCHYVHSPVGCQNGESCGFCHMPHVKKKAARPCKSKRQQCKKFIKMLEEVSEKNPENLGEAMKNACARSTYLKDMLTKRLPPEDRPPNGEVDQLINSMTARHQPGNSLLAMPTEAPRRKNIMSL